MGHTKLFTHLHAPPSTSTHLPATSIHLHPPSTHLHPTPPTDLLLSKNFKKMIVSLFYVVLNLLGLSFLEKGKALLLGSVFPVMCQTSFLKKKTHFNDHTGLDRAWWFCRHVNTFYYIYFYYSSMFKVQSK